jgi:hypothetical protein
MTIRPSGILSRKTGLTSGRMSGYRYAPQAAHLSRRMSRSSHREGEGSLSSLTHKLVNMEKATPVRSALERRFNHDFSQVRIHTNGPASQLVQSLGAEALTFGHEIAFRPGAYQPNSSSGQRLLAHELAHVAQQSGLMGESGSASQTLHSNGRYQQKEQEAERVAESVSRDETSIRQAGERHHNEDVLPLPESPAPHLQLYAVPGSLECGEVVDWLNSNSPYAPEWAETRSTYSFNGSATTSSRNLPDGTVEIHVRGNRGMGVSVNSPIDMPSWSPGPRTNRQAEVAAWNAMITVLGAHEHQHRTIAANWRVTLEGNWRGVDFTVTGATAADARQAAVDELESQKTTWGQQAQDAQDAIDPFRGAVLNCPSAPPQQSQETNP